MDRPRRREPLRARPTRAGAGTSEALPSAPPCQPPSQLRSVPLQQSRQEYEYSAGLLLGMAIAGWLVIGIVLWPLCIHMASRSRRMGDARGTTLAALIIASIGASLILLGLAATIIS